MGSITQNRLHRQPHLLWSRICTAKRRKACLMASNTFEPGKQSPSLSQHHGTQQRMQLSRPLDTRGRLTLYLASCRAASQQLTSLRPSWRICQCALIMRTTVPCLRCTTHMDMDRILSPLLDSGLSWVCLRLRDLASVHFAHHFLEPTCQYPSALYSTPSSHNCSFLFRLQFSSIGSFLEYLEYW